MQARPSFIKFLNTPFVIKVCFLSGAVLIRQKNRGTTLLRRLIRAHSLDLVSVVFFPPLTRHSSIRH